MDAAYDHIQEQSFPDDEDNGRRPKDGSNDTQPSSINADFQEAYKAFSNSPWGARIGGFLGSVAKQVRGKGSFIGLFTNMAIDADTYAGRGRLSRGTARSEQHWAGSYKGMDRSP